VSVPPSGPSGATGERLAGRAGSLALLAGLGASLMLAARHLGRSLVGCALDSPCERALSSAWAHVPVLGWPVAFVGLAYFAALLVAWGTGGGPWPRALAWLTRVGALLSCVFLVAAFGLEAPCPYCLTAQFANLAFLVASERRRSAEPAPRVLVRAAVAGALVLAAAVGLALQRARAQQRSAGRELEAARDARVDEVRGFTGRHRRGPAEAALRLVLFLDYRCPDCRRLDVEASALQRARPDLSLSLKHFPLDADCNRRARALGRDPHPGACLAARAAEAADLGGGDAAFWRVHDWLFAQETAPTLQSLERALPALGLAPGPFLEALHGTEAARRVADDVEEALALGVEGTPAVFLNGVELREWRAPGALTRAVETLAARAPAVVGPEADRPLTGLERALADWRAQPRRELATRPGLPGAAAGLELVLWGDLLDAPTRELLARLRPALAARPDARLVVRHYPLDPACVPGAPALHPGACALARLAEAARILGGEAALARLEPWLVTRVGPGPFDALEAARQAGLPPAELEELALAPSTQAALVLDVDAAKRLGIHSVPLLFIDGKRVPRWRLDGEGDVLAALLAEAGQ